jgi:hypothetical protein
MANDKDESDNFIDSFSLHNCMLVAYPNYLILGQPEHKDYGLKFKKNSYFKITSADFENWFRELHDALTFFSSENSETLKTIICKETRYSYFWSGITRGEEKSIEIGCSLQGIEKNFFFSQRQLESLLFAFGQLMLGVFCLKDKSYQCFCLVLNHFVNFKSDTDTLASEIAVLNLKRLLSLCKNVCKKNDLDGSQFKFAEIILRYKLQLLMMFLIKRGNYEINSILLNRFKDINSTFN